MKFYGFIFVVLLAAVRAQYNCGASTTGLLTGALSNPLTASMNGLTASGPDSTFPLSSTSIVTVKMQLVGDRAYLDGSTRDFGPNGQKTSTVPSVLDFTRYPLESGLSVLSFNPPVASFVFKMNYNPDMMNVSQTVKITVNAENGTTLSCYDIEALAPIRTPAQTDGFAYRGATSYSNNIASVFISGPSMAYWDITFALASTSTPQNIVGVPASNPSSTKSSEASTLGSMAIGLSFLYSLMNFL